MADTDSTRSSAPDARGADDDGATQPAAPADAGAGAVPDGDGVRGVAQRHDLPRRKAATLPAAVRDHDDERTGSTDAAGDAASGGSADDGTDGPPDADVVAGGAHTASAAAVDAPDATRSDEPGAAPDAPGAAQDGRDSAPVGGRADSPAAGDAPAPATGQIPASAPERAAAPAVGPGATPAAPPAPSEPSTDTAALSLRPPDAEAARRAAARDQAAAAKPALARFLQVVVALFFPVIVVAAAVRAVATSSFLWLEYHRPGFPADQYGFSLDDRMTYGSYALDYVLNFAPPRYLGGLVTPEGEPLFLESEVGHMADVKGVLGLSFFIALVLFVLAVLACAYLARRYKGGVRRALFAGAALTLVGAAVLTVLAVLAWETFFTQVHALFFADGTWTFRVDDTLIRLFPEQFWTDSAITVAVLVLGATVLTLILTWPTAARRERSARAQAAAQGRYREAIDA